MKTTSHTCVVATFQGFEVYHLVNEEVSIEVVPELGARIISLKNLRSGREWLGHPPGEKKLFTNRAGDDFAASPLVGMDECLPTITPCEWKGRPLPDHGEVWAKHWTVDEPAWQNGILKTAVRLETSPFYFERAMELAGNEVCLNYRLQNLSPHTESFIWAMHPLLGLQAEDQLELPDSTRALLRGTCWQDGLAAAVPANGCDKTFAGPVTEGQAAVCNPKTGDRLEINWNSTENDVLGLWLSRGGWHGQHQFALEPTNANHDSLAVAARHKRCRELPPSGSATWQVKFIVSS